MQYAKRHQRTVRRRAARTRARIKGTSDRPRLSVFRSNQFLYAQLIDDTTGKTIVSASSRSDKKHHATIGHAEAVGATIAAGAKKAGITQAVADRGAYRYHGRVKALVEAARKNGLRI